MLENEEITGLDLSKDKNDNNNKSPFKGHYLIFITVPGAVTFWSSCWLPGNLTDDNKTAGGCIMIVTKLLRCS